MSTHADPLKTRCQVDLPVDLQNRTGTWTQQWLLEKSKSLPPRQDGTIQTFIGGEAGFRQIATDILAAKESINLVCWGFDPGMALVRNACTTEYSWTQGLPYGELLRRKAEEGVKVRLLVWYDAIGSATQNSLVGYVNPDEFLVGGVINRTWDEINNLTRSMSAAASMGWGALYDAPPVAKPVWAQRLDYCTQWWRQASSGQIKNLEVRSRAGIKAKVKESLQTEADAPSEQAAQKVGLVHEVNLLQDYATHHQKPIVIDYGRAGAQMGYVMGLNSVSDYWDSQDHKLDDPRREQHLQGENDALGRVNTSGDLVDCT